MEWKSSASNMKVFGSIISFMYIDDQVRTKLRYKSKKMSFMGYDQKSKGYMIYNPNKENIVISRDVERAHLMFDGTYSEHFLFFPFSVKDMCKAKLQRKFSWEMRYFYSCSQSCFSSTLHRQSA